MARVLVSVIGSSEPLVFGMLTEEEANRLFLNLVHGPSLNRWEVIRNEKHATSTAILISNITDITLEL